MQTGTVCLDSFPSFSGDHSGVEQLAHTAGVCVVFKESVQLCSEVAEPLYTPRECVRVQSLHTPTRSAASLSNPSRCKPRWVTPSYRGLQCPHLGEPSVQLCPSFTAWCQASEREGCLETNPGEIASAAPWVHLTQKVA